MAPGDQEEVEVADNWESGRIWARTGCDIVEGLFMCLTGGCGAGAEGNGLGGSMEWCASISSGFCILN
jgi:hypothetical protein